MRVISSAPRTSTVASAKLPKAQAGQFLVSSTLAAMLFVQPAFASNGVSFANLKDGAKVASPVHIDFAISGKEVKAVAEGDLSDKSGHFHLIIDGEKFTPAGEAIPFDDIHKHFGKGQKSVDLELAPGKHSLTLQFANIKHESYGQEWAKNINVIVQ